jgi:hypothetical protein
MEEINQKRRFWSNLRFLKGYRTRLEIWPDKSSEVDWNLVYWLDISGDQNRIVQFAKPNNPVYKTGWQEWETRGFWGKTWGVLTWMRNRRNLGKTWGADKNKRNIDKIHIGLYHLENEILDITMSFQFIHIWTWFDDLNWEKGYSRNLIQEKG